MTKADLFHSALDGLPVARHPMMPITSIARQFNVTPLIAEFLLRSGEIRFSPNGGFDPSEAVAAVENFVREAGNVKPDWAAIACRRGVPRWRMAQAVDEQLAPQSRLYFIGSTAAIKIGISGAPASRLKALQTAHWEPLAIIAEMKGAEWTEAALHEMFEDIRLSGEWFRRDARLLRFIECEVST